MGNGPDRHIFTASREISVWRYFEIRKAFQMDESFDATEMGAMDLSNLSARVQ